MAIGRSCGSVATGRTALSANVIVQSQSLRDHRVGAPPCDSARAAAGGQEDGGSFENRRRALSSNE
jgi:hypothetical protein